MSKGRLFVVSAPSGAGKSTLIERVRTKIPYMLYSVSCTTRLPRSYETEGVDYYFMDRPGFERLAHNGGLLEWKEVHGNLYGTPAASVFSAIDRGASMLLDLDVQGAQEVFRRIPSSVGIFITAPDMDELERRLRARGSDSEESIRTRMANALQELQCAHLFAYRVVNDDVEEAVQALCSIITKCSVA
jgi:guanylate kinase